MFTRCMLPLALAASLVSGAASAATYEIETHHTYPSLEMSHMGISIWRGKFNKSSGTVTYDARAKTGSVDIKTETASIDFGHDEMNKHSIAEDWLNAAQFPTLEYKGKLVFKGKGADPTEVDGQLTMRGVTKPLKLKIKSFKCIDHPFYKKEVCGADAEGTLDRADYGMTQYADNGMGKILIRIQVEAIRQD